MKYGFNKRYYKKKRTKLPTYRIYIGKTKFVPTKIKARGYAKAKDKLLWFKLRGIKAYAKKSVKKY